MLTRRWMGLALAMALVPVAVAGAIEDARKPGASVMPDALGRAPGGDASAARPMLHATRDVVVDTHKRLLIVLATPAKHRKVVTLLQRLVADDKPAAAPAVMPPKTQRGPSRSYKYQQENVMLVIRDLAEEARVNIIVRGPPVTTRLDLEFRDVAARDLLKLVLDVHNFNYQMSPNGETLVIFTGRMHRTLESYVIPAKLAVPLEQLVNALQTTVLDVEDPEGGADDFEHLPAGGGGVPGGPGLPLAPPAPPLPPVPPMPVESPAGPPPVSR